MNDSSSLIG